MITFVFGMDHVHHLHSSTHTVVPTSQCQFCQNPMLCGLNSILMVPMKTKDLSWGWSLCLKVTFQHCTHRLYVFNVVQISYGVACEGWSFNSNFQHVNDNLKSIFHDTLCLLQCSVMVPYWLPVRDYIKYCTVSCLNQGGEHQNKKLIKSMYTQSWLNIGK